MRCVVRCECGVFYFGSDCFVCWGFWYCECDIVVGDGVYWGDWFLMCVWGYVMLDCSVVYGGVCCYWFYWGDYWIGIWCCGCYCCGGVLGLVVCDGFVGGDCWCFFGGIGWVGIWLVFCMLGGLY